MRRAVITGMGIVSSIGANIEEVADSLKATRSGIDFVPEYQELGFKSQVAGDPAVKASEHVPKRAMRFMEDGSAWTYMSMQEAIEMSGLEESQISHPRSGLIMGTGGPSTKEIVRAAKITQEKGPKRIGPFAVPKAMCSGVSAALATPFKILGLNFSVSSACTTSAHCIGLGAQQIAWDQQDIIFAGGGEELHWSLSALFDAMGAMSSGYNETAPKTASRAFDKNRDGFVIAGGAGAVVLEEYEHAKKRGAVILGEVTGFGATSDGHDMVAPSGEGAVRCMQQALKKVTGPVDYVNPHATSTPVGDIKEAQALREVFGSDVPALSATKSLTGHSLGGAGVQEAIYSLIMMRDSFKAASAHIEELDPEFADLPIIREYEDAKVNRILSNSFGFGGTNGTLVIDKVE